VEFEPRSARILELSVVDGHSKHAENELVDVVGGVVHVVLSQADRGRARRANLETQPRPVAQRHVQTHVVGTIRRHVLLCRHKNKYMG